MCPAGQAPKADKSGCEVCAAGSAPKADLSACEVCAAGSAPKADKSACEVCSLGSAPKADKSACEVRKLHDSYDTLVCRYYSLFLLQASDLFLLCVYGSVDGIRSQVFLGSLSQSLF